MTREETAKVLTMIATHYWQTANIAERNIDLMIETWTRALADMPLRPHIELALDDWFRTEKWPPQASELRQRATELSGATIDPRTLAEMQERVRALGAREEDVVATNW